MENGSSLELVLLLLLILSCLALAPFVLAIYGQRRIQETLKGIGLRLRQLRKQVQQLRLSTQRYSPSDPEPYGSIASALGKGLNDLDAQVRQLHEEYAQLRTRASMPAIPEDFRLLMRLPWEWYEANRLTRELRRDVDRANRSLEITNGLAAKLEKQGWEVALQARQLLQDTQKAYHQLEMLRTRGLSDASLDNWIEQGKDWERKLKSQVPVYFLSASEEEVLAQDDRQAVSEVYRLVSSGRSTMSGLLAKGREWDEQVTALEQVCTEMTALFQELSTEMRDLENNRPSPVLWDRSHKALSAIGQQVDMIAQVKKPRTLEGVKKDLAAALALLDQIRALSDSYRKTAAMHQELLELLGSAEIQGGPDWCRGAQKLTEVIAAYDPENWPRADGVAKLRAELQALCEQQTALINIQEPEPGKVGAIRESELEKCLTSARQLANMHADLRPRVANIQDRLSEIQATERAAQEHIARARALLNQAESIILSNPLLTRSASELKSLRDNLEALAAQLDQPGRGTVESKAQRADALLRKIEQSINTWLAQLQADLQAKMASLGESIARLNSIALLDDPAIAEAQRLLASAQQKSRPDKYRRKADLPLIDAVAELKRYNEDWQRCVSTLKALETIEGSVIDDHARAAAMREEALQQIARAVELIPENRSWPPTNQNISVERQELTRIEQQWKALAQERIQPIRLVSRLGSLAGEYQSLAARLNQKVERAGQEQNRFRELENRLSESKSMWQNQMHLYADNAVTRDEIQLLLEEVEQESEAIRERYRRGAIPYNQALQMLRMVCQKLDDALIPLDPTRDIDINGQQYARR